MVDSLLIINKMLGLLRELFFEEKCKDAEVNHILFIPQSLNAEAGVLEMSILLVRSSGDLGTFALIVSFSK